MASFQLMIYIFVWLLINGILCLAGDHRSARIEFGSQIVIGGLFPVHRKVSNEDERCGPILLEKGIQRLEAMLYAIDQINKNLSYWKFSMDATILDTCSSDSYALEQSLQFLHYSCGPNANISRKVVAVVGASNSVVSASVANIFRLFQIPQVSYASTSEELDDLHKYPYFFRVVPSDKFQVRVILDILLEFGWTYVSLVASKGEYGENAVQNLKDLVRETSHEGICFATVEVLPRDAADQHYDAVIRRLSLNDKAKVVVVFLNEDKISKLLDSCERSGINAGRFIWLGSDGWGAKVRTVQNHEDLAEGAITILPKRYPIDDFDNYFKSLKPFSNTRNPWFKEFWEEQFDCVFKKTTSAKRRKICTGTEDLSKDYQQEGLVPMVIDSVQLLATAIKTLCKEEPKFCKDPEKIDTKYRNSLIEIIGNTTLQSSQGHNMVISFDKTRSVPVNYTIFQYQQSRDNKCSYKLIGEWNPSDRLKLQDDPVWSKGVTDDLRRPLSTCSEECAHGQERIRNMESNRQCCWTCRPCDDTYYLPEPSKPCMPCPEGQIPSEDRKSCVDLQAEFIGKSLANPWAVIPLVFSILGLISTSAVFVIFFMNHKTPIIMASGRELCYVILIGIVLCYCFPFIVLFRPTDISCGALRIGMGLGLSVCYSAIFTKTNRLSRIFEVSLKFTKRPSYISPESQVMICVCLVLIQITLTVLWLIIKPPIVLQKLVPSPRMWVIYCGVDGISVLLGLLYNMVLLILCTVYAYKTRNIPENFNETKWISFTMYSSCIIWLAFIPIFCSAMQDYKVQTTILSMSVSASGTVTLVCIFLPKIYIVLFHPERNVRYPSSTATSGTGTCDSNQAVRYLRTVPKALDVPQPAPVQRPDSPFLFNQNHRI
ncbi:hypothetical protein CDAR_82951 [Caerostris darwini]|uniref:G-protein coupled receptors family 3 profile domain-containing protein n=1 Tax=Caerostris darwini TaxID=1538125 RepID=A0AAV4NXQ6_9ARAC|nr:hypothetical protein CDAR_82951 [Caerostris darwini]